MCIKTAWGGMEDGTWNKALCFVCITSPMGQLVCVCSIGGGAGGEAEGGRLNTLENWNQQSC
jgi:hypothetical protein